MEKLAENGRHFTPHLICYMDVLGFKSKIDRIKKNKEKQAAFLKAYFDEGAAFAEIVKGDKSLDGFNLQIRIISDSIIVTLPLLDSSALVHAFKAICIAAGRIQAAMSANDFWLRGAICADDLYTERAELVVGPGLIRAYLLEEEHAEFPRVIVDPRLDNVKKAVPPESLGFGHHPRFSSEYQTLH